MAKSLKEMFIENVNLYTKKINTETKEVVFDNTDINTVATDHILETLEPLYKAESRKLLNDLGKVSENPMSKSNINLGNLYDTPQIHNLKIREKVYEEKDSDNTKVDLGIVDSSSSRSEIKIPQEQLYTEKNPEKKIIIKETIDNTKKREFSKEDLGRMYDTSLDNFVKQELGKVGNDNGNVHKALLRKLENVYNKTSDKITLFDVYKNKEVSLSEIDNGQLSNNTKNSSILHNVNSPNQEKISPIPNDLDNLHWEHEENITKHSEDILKKRRGE